MEGVKEKGSLLWGFRPQLLLLLLDWGGGDQGACRLHLPASFEIVPRPLSSPGTTFIFSFFLCLFTLQERAGWAVIKHC